MGYPDFVVVRAKGNCKSNRRSFATLRMTPLRE
jgi:hypothetical protein